MSLNDPNWGRNAGQKSDSDQGSRRPKSNDGPPDLDELWRDFNRRLSSLFGGRGGDPGNSGGNRPGTPFGSRSCCCCGLAVAFISSRKDRPPL